VYENKLSVRILEIGKNIFGVKKFWDISILLILLTLSIKDKDSINIKLIYWLELIKGRRTDWLILARTDWLILCLADWLMLSDSFFNSDQNSNISSYRNL
jgi:hypothetical protein